MSTFDVATAKKIQQEKPPDDEPSAKKVCSSAVIFSGDPDVIVVVGGQEFHEHSYHLRSWSGYFDGAFRSGMQEAQLMRFEFPDGDPSDWKLITALAERFPTTQITTDSLPVALSWFDMLCVPRGVAKCDEFLATELGRWKAAVINWHSDLDNASEMKGTVKHVMDGFAASMKYNLPLSKARAFEALGPVMTKAPFFIEEDEVSLVAKALMEDEAFRKEIWDSIVPLLPTAITDKKKLIGNDLLPALILSGIQLKEKDHRMKSEARKILIKIDGFKFRGRDSVFDFRP